MADSRLAACEPDDTDGLSEAHAAGELEEIKRRLAEVQDRFSAAADNALLIILQGVDASGKEHVISDLLRAFDPAVVRVHNFTTPSEEDEAHDFLWRFHPHTPAKGMVHVFDRSHYEEVVYPRVHRLLDDDQWHARLESINDFERLLHREGTVIVKLMLHVSKRRQGERLEARLEDRREQHEFSADDVKERGHWRRYRTAYEDVLAATDTEAAPWHVLPADVDWFIPVAAGRILLERLEGLDPQYPGLDPDEAAEAGVG